MTSSAALAAAWLPLLLLLLLLLPAVLSRLWVVKLLSANAA
jgi:hypothetical protein